MNMQVTAEMILSDFGAILPLDQRRRDALAAYTRAAAGDARSKTLWAQRTWDLKDYEAKDLLKGNASESVWERILKHRNGGWRVALPVLGAVIGESFDDFISSERQRLANEHARIASENARLASLAGDLGAALGLGVRRASGLGVRAPQEPRHIPGGMGDGDD